MSNIPKGGICCTPNMLNNLFTRVPWLDASGVHASKTLAKM